MSPFPAAAPIAPRARPWRFPETEHLRLSSGLEVQLLRQTEIPVLHLRLESRAGRWMAAPGVAGLMASTSRHGTARYSSAALAHRQDGLGARLGSAAGQDRLQVTARGLSEHAAELLELLSEIALHPSFPEAELAREREQLAERRRHGRSDPGALAGEWLAAALYGEHPYGRPLPEPEALLGIPRRALVDFHAAARTPENSVLFAVGDVDPEALRDGAEAALAGWSGNPRLPEPPPPPRPRRGRRVILVHRPDSPQVRVAVGLQAIPRGDPDYVAARVLNQVLGGGVTSRLFMDLREARSLTYGCYSSLDAGVLAGDLSAGLSCAAPKLGEALGALLEHLERLRDEAVPAGELSLAQQYLTGAFPSAGSTLGGLCGMLAGRWLHRLPEDIWARYTGMIEAVTPADLHRVARRLLHPERAAIVAVGDAGVIEGALAAFGEVERRGAGELPRPG